MAPEDKPPPSLEDLASRLRRARGKDQPSDGLRTPTSNLGRAFHLAIEMAAGLAVGGAIGWFLDDWLDTKPWLLVLFLFLGLGAGVRNVMRTISRFNAELERRERGAGNAARDDGTTDDRG
jgi:ATP synthase protein I